MSGSKEWQQDFPKFMGLNFFTHLTFWDTRQQAHEMIFCSSSCNFDSLVVQFRNNSVSSAFEKFPLYVQYTFCIRFSISLFSPVKSLEREILRMARKSSSSELITLLVQFQVLEESVLFVLQTQDKAKFLREPDRVNELKPILNLYFEVISPKRHIILPIYVVFKFEISLQRKKIERRLIFTNEQACISLRRGVQKQ